MSLLRKIQEATTNPNFRLADVLRMAKVLSARLDHQPLKDWIEKELNGYGVADDLPPYRTLTNLGSRGDFFYSFGRGYRNLPIPLLSLPKEFAESISKVNVGESVSAIENTVSQANHSGTSILHSPWPADTFAIFGSKIYDEMNCGQAWRDIPTSSLVAILDTVKNSILDFVLEIEAEAPEAGEAEPGTELVPEAVVTQIFNNCVLHQNNHSDKSQTITTYSKKELIMSENRSTNIHAGRDASGITSGSDVSGVVAGGNISGIVTNKITQLQNLDAPEALQLAELLNQLQAVIEAESSLTSDDKELALEQVAVLADEGKEPKKESRIKPVKTAIAALKGIAGALPPATELVKECNQLLPVISSFFGLG